MESECSLGRFFAVRSPYKVVRGTRQVWLGLWVLVLCPGFVQAEDAQKGATTAPAVEPAPAVELPASSAAPAEEPSDFEKWLNGKRLTGDWGGARTWMDSKGIDFSMIWTGVYQQNFSGGLETHNAEAFPGDFRVNLLMDFDKMGWIPGGFMFVRGKSTWTGGIRPDVGSLKSTSWALDGGCEPFYADKYWYGQYLLDKRIEFRIGKLLTPDLFDNAAYASDLPWDQFMNENLAINSTVPHRKSLGAYVKVRPTDWLYFGTGATDADQRDATRCIGFDTTFHDDTQHFVGMWELGLTPSFKTAKGLLPGNYKFGWWYDPRVKNVFKDPKRDRYMDTTVGDDVGFYTTMDQLVWKENEDPKDKQGLGMFLRYGFGHREVNRIAHFWSLGAQYEGLIPSRNGDVLGFGVAQNIMSTKYRYYVNELADRETVYEVYYAIKVTPWCVISPDIQVITNPGGNQNARDSFIGGLRVKITF